MKTAGIILIVLGGINLIAGIVELSSGYGVSSRFSGASMFIVLGAFLLSRANKKKQEDEERELWNNQK